MSLALDLLDQADHLSQLDARRPKQANLRRAVSASYYSLFHLLVAEASRRLLPGGSAELSKRMARTFTHGEMKETCQKVTSPNPGQVLRSVLPAGFSAPMRQLATTFIELQKARHEADYDLSIRLTRVETIELVDLARAAFADWNMVRMSDEAEVFLAALAFGKRWDK